VKDQSEVAIAWRQRIITGLRIVCGGLCAYDAWQKWQPGFAATYLSALKLASDNSLPLAHTWFSTWFTLAHSDIQVFTFVISILELILAVCLLCGALTRSACGLGIFLSLLGGTSSVHSINATGSVDYGMMVLLLLSFLGLLLSNAGQPFGVDAWLRHTTGANIRNHKSDMPAIQQTGSVAFQPAQQPAYPSTDQRVVQLADRQRAQSVSERPGPARRQRISSM
jgi:nitrite reductase (NO-forming)